MKRFDDYDSIDYSVIPRGNPNPLWVQIVIIASVIFAILFIVFLFFTCTEAQSQIKPQYYEPPTRLEEFGP